MFNSCTLLKLGICKLRCHVFQLLIIFALVGSALNAQAQSSVQATTAQEQLNEARKANCKFKPELNALEEILCNGEIKIGVRADYRLFSELRDGTYSGYEIDIANAIATKLGVQIKFISVTSSNQIRRLAAGEIDIILASMAHTTERDKILHSVRPHYYASPTTIVGNKNIVVRDWSDLREKAICVPIGNFSNIEFSKRKEGHKLMIYGDPTKLTQALALGACALIAHDQSYVRAYLTGPKAPSDMRARFDEKVSFFEVPWAIGVSEEAKDSLGRWLSLTLADMHQTGVLVELASQHGVSNSFLETEKQRWSQAPCTTSTAFDQTCLRAPGITSDPPSMLFDHFKQVENMLLHGVLTVFAAVRQAEEFLVRSTFTQISFPMFTGEGGLRWFIDGIQLSLLLALGSIFSTLFFGVCLFKLIGSRSHIQRHLAKVLLIFFQNSPVILLLILGYLGVSLLWGSSLVVSVLSAVTVIGLNNGANLGAAMYEASLAKEPNQSLLSIAQAAMLQIRAALINAVKATPVASFVGVPELLTTLTDITSFSGNQFGPFLILVIFYICLIQAIVILIEQMSKRLASGRGV